MLGDIDFLGISKVLEPRGQSNRVALSRIVHAQVVPDLPDDYLARVQPHADMEIEPDVASYLLTKGLQPLAQVQRRMAGSLGVILVRDRSAEQRHDPVTGVLVDGPFEAVHTSRENGEEPGEKAVPDLRIDAPSHLHRLLHVGEQDRYLLAFPFNR